jgi:hypothetical protein
MEDGHVVVDAISEITIEDITHDLAASPASRSC